MNGKETQFTSLYNGICCYVSEGKMLNYLKENEVLKSSVNILYKMTTSLNNWRINWVQPWCCNIVANNAWHVSTNRNSFSKKIELSLTKKELQNKMQKNIASRIDNLISLLLLFKKIIFNPLTKMSKMHVFIAVLFFFINYLNVLRPCWWGCRLWHSS